MLLLDIFLLFNKREYFGDGFLSSFTSHFAMTCLSSFNNSSISELNP